MRGDFQLTEGTTLDILVGQMGSANTSGEWSGCGGGGGSFVVNAAENVPLIVAAGGAGSDGSGDYESRPKPGGSAETGVLVASSSNGASGSGGGFQHNGESRHGGGFVAQSFLNGGIGGLCNEDSDVAHGGFGGGGAGDHYSMGGAGGGYQGGSAIAGYDPQHGLTPAKSFNSGSNQNNTSGISTNDGTTRAHGSVQVIYLGNQ